MKKDILKLVAYFNVYGLDLYGVKHHGLDTGKNNLESYFCDKLNWSESKLKRLVSLLVREQVLRRERVEAGITCLSLGILHRDFLYIMEV